MDTRTGDIYKGEQAKKMKEIFANRIKKMNLPPSPEQLLRRPTNQAAVGRVGRNDPCPCGSGKKFKNCCLER